MTLLKQACQYLGVDEATVVSHGVNELEGHIAIVVDNGIAGSPKYTVPLSKLSEKVEETATPKPETPNYAKMKVSELRALVKDAGGDPARLKKSELIDILAGK